jgi:hypothetical protein
MAASHARSEPLPRLPRVARPPLRTPSEPLRMVQGGSAVFPEFLHDVQGVSAAFAESLHDVQGVSAAFPGSWHDVQGVSAAFAESLHDVLGVSAAFPESWHDVQSDSAAFPESLHRVQGVSAVSSESQHHVHRPGDSAMPPGRRLRRGSGGSGVVSGMCRIVCTLSGFSVREGGRTEMRKIIFARRNKRRSAFRARPCSANRAVAPALLEGVCSK